MVNSISKLLLPPFITNLVWSKIARVYTRLFFLRTPKERGIRARLKYVCRIFLQVPRAKWQISFGTVHLSGGGARVIRGAAPELCECPLKPADRTTLSII